MANFLAQYSRREKAIVALALLVLVALTLHAFVIEPYQTRVATLRGQIEQQTADLTWMQSVVARLPAATVNVTSSKINGSLASFIDQAVKRQGLSGQLAQMTPIGNDEVRMRYSAVDFNRLVNFIGLIQSSGLEVKDIRISSSDNPGIVDSSIIFARL